MQQCIVGVVAKGTAIGAGGLGFHSRTGHIDAVLSKLATAATFPRSSVAQALNHGVEPAPLDTRFGVIPRV